MTVKKVKSKRVSSSKFNAEFRIPYRNYTLIIAEKPKAAAKIAEALGLGSKGRAYNIPFWWGYYNGKCLVVVPSAGHLFTLNTNERGYPVFNYEWVPRWIHDKKASHLSKFYKAIKILARHASEYINACDFDIEGSVIGYLIIKELGSLSKAKRAKFSSLTRDELKRAFNNLLPLDTYMVEAGLCRHELDWIWGINVSRALMDVYKVLMNEWKVLSAGRVQSPTLIEVYNRYLERETFIPKISFTISIKINYKGLEFNLEPTFSPFLRYEEALRYAKLIKDLGLAKVIDLAISTKILNPPPPFNLPDLQIEASRVYGYSPAETLAKAEDLYLEGLISYPRTNSQKLPPSLDNRSIMKSLSKIPQYSLYIHKLLSRKVLTYSEGSKTDPAHPAIYPTGELPSRVLGKKERNIFDLIIRRYLASFGEPAKIIYRRYLFSVAGLKFILRGSSVITRGWLEIYPFYEVKEVEVPPLKIGDNVRISSVKVLTLYSKPPQLYTKTSLLRWMERVNIGTESTRAEIIEILFKRGYLRNTSRGIEVTDVGMIVANVLNKLFNEITNVGLTRKFEEYLNDVMQGKISRHDVVSEARNILSQRLVTLRRLLREEGRDYVLRLCGIGYGTNKCSLCWRAASQSLSEGVKLCDIHMKAYLNLINMYKEWKKQLNLSFNEYITKLRKLSSVGRIVKDVIELIVKYRLNPE